MYIKRTLCLLAVGCLAAFGVTSAAAQSPIDEKVTADEKTRTVFVNCNSGQSLQTALDKFTRGAPLIVEFAGTCQQGNIVIRRDDTTLRGRNPETAIIDGQLAVKGADRVKLESFTAINAIAENPVFDRNGDGLLIFGSQEVYVEGVTILDSGSRGLNAENGSSVYLTDIVIRRAAGIGLVATGNASLTLFGRIEVTDNFINGSCVFNAGTLFVKPGAEVIIERNPIGVLIEGNGAVTVADNTLFSVRDSESHGLMVVTQGALNVAGSLFDTSDNGGFGMVVLGIGHIERVPGTFPRFVMRNNGEGGLGVVRGGNVDLPSGTLIEDNAGPGILVDGSTLWMQNTTLRNNGNGQGGLFLFNSQITFGGGNDISGSLFCDGTVSMRGGSCESSSSDASAAAVYNPWDLVQPSVREALGKVLSR